MTPKTMAHEEACQILIDAGYEDGWVIGGIQLVLWEHVEDPPPPFKRPA
jgi:hypothetical protein